MTAEADSNFDFALSLDDRGRLSLIDRHGARHDDVRPVRCFPVTSPDAWISLCDPLGAELAVIEDLSQAPRAMRECVDAVLRRREFMPVIQRIRDLTPYSLPAEWEVRTDRGTTRFEIRSQEDLRRLGANQALVFDAHGMRYLIADISSLDAASRHALDRHL